MKLPKGQKVVYCKWVFNKKEETPRLKNPSINQGWLQKVTVRFNIQSAKPVSTPLTPHFRLSLALSQQSDDEIDYIDLDKRRSLIRYIFTIGGCTINWKATLQTTVALSATKAEYMAITEACKEVICLKELFGELSKDLRSIQCFVIARPWSGLDRRRASAVAPPWAAAGDAKWNLFGSSLRLVTGGASGWAVMDTNRTSGGGGGNGRGPKVKGRRLGF
ncbi:uncharacterized protein [Gossypium hirsutum]|uniref:Uncharacterized protein n=1 Tax=Gossypium hirsutum TaxID=3635 RepID=A0ABM3B9V2_GOSHI|nr:uncharacterized protein LOC121224490 [Gossypium hirsutum]